MVTPDGKWITFDGGETFSLVPGYVSEPHREDVVDSSAIAQERDALTQLRTLSDVHRALEEAIGASPTRSVALLYIDIDDFHAFNHEYGHRAGDDVLVEFANRLVEVVGGDSGLFRTGGEEFLAVLPNATVDAACAVAERVCERVRNEPFQLSLGGGGLTTSIGVVCASGQDATWDAVWGAADRALLESKRNGRNRWTLAT